MVGRQSFPFGFQLPFREGQLSDHFQPTEVCHYLGNLTPEQLLRWEHQRLLLLARWEHDLLYGDTFCGSKII